MLLTATFSILISIRALLKSNCYHKEGHDASCMYGGNIYMLMFGVVEIVMSQIPDFHSMVLVSAVAAIMSFCYASIGFGLGFAKTVGTNAFVFRFSIWCSSQQCDHRI